MPLELTDHRPPLPPLDLIQRVVDPFGPDEADSQSAAFDQWPPVFLRGFERALGLQGKEFADFTRLLDFGCGPGRLIRHLGPLARTVEIHGTDIDEAPIRWLRDNVPYGSYEVAPHSPPTVYEDEYFD